MTTLFSDLTILKHKDFIGISNRRKPVCDNNTSDIAKLTFHVIDCFLNFLFILLIKS